MQIREVENADVQVRQIVKDLVDRAVTAEKKVQEQGVLIKSLKQEIVDKNLLVESFRKVIRTNKHSV